MTMFMIGIIGQAITPFVALALVPHFYIGWRLLFGIGAYAGAAGFAGPPRALGASRLGPLSPRRWSLCLPVFPPRIRRAAIRFLPDLEGLSQGDTVAPDPVAQLLGHPDLDHVIRAAWPGQRVPDLWVLWFFHAVVPFARPV